MSKKNDLKEREKLAFEEFLKNYRMCPCCNEVKELKDFGHRWMRNKLHIQSWCKKCRTKKKGE